MKNADAELTVCPLLKPIDSMVDRLCIVDKCMAWHTDDFSEKLGHCKLIDTNIQDE